MSNTTTMTFFARFESDIKSGKKTITIRDESEKDYVIGTVIRVSTLEEGREFCRLKIISVEPILFDELSDFHAKQENMSLPSLKELIQDIYPGNENFYVITFKLVNVF